MPTWFQWTKKHLCMRIVCIFSRILLPFTSTLSCYVVSRFILIFSMDVNTATLSHKKRCNFKFLLGYRLSILFYIKRFLMLWYEINWMALNPEAWFWRWHHLPYFSHNNNFILGLFCMIIFHPLEKKENPTLQLEVAREHPLVSWACTTLFHSTAKSPYAPIEDNSGATI
jgi:hypothetical protein